MSNAARVFHTKAYKRNDLEKYYTPGWVIDALLPHFDVAGDGWTWEPAAGDGQIVRALQGAGARVVASDLAPDRHWITRQDFFALRSVPAIVNKIVTNPPFGVGGRLGLLFAEQALRLIEPVQGRVAMLLRDDFDSAPGRVHLFRDHPAFALKVVVTKRIRWTNLPQKRDGPSNNHAWYIWDWRHTGRPELVYA